MRCWSSGLAHQKTDWIASQETLNFCFLASPIQYYTSILWLCDDLSWAFWLRKLLQASMYPRTKWPRVDTFFCFFGSTDKKLFDASYDSVAFVIVQEGFWLFLPLWLWLGRNTQRGVSDAVKVLEKPKSSLVAYGVWLQYPVDNVLPSNRIRQFC